MNTLGTKEVHNISMTQIKAHNNITHNNLMEKVIESSNLKNAYKRVLENKGSAGIDDMTTVQLKPYLKENWEIIKQELLEGTYKPKPVKRVEIPKSGGGKRQLGIPTVLDRFIQQAILQVFTPIFDPMFSDSSFGFRPKRSAKQAVIKAQEYIQQGKEIVVDIDLEKFFDRVNHDILMTKLARIIKDKRIITIIRRYLQAGIMLNGCRVISDEGTPQGGPLSPLLANIMLNDLDKELTKRKHTFVRYADDCNIYVSSKRAGQRVFASIKKFLEERLRLKVNTTKSAVDRPWKRKILGFTFYKRQGINLTVAPVTITKFKSKIKELTNRSWSISMQTRITKLNAYITGWGNYFAIAENKRKFQELDEWIRRRLRMCQIKQWKKPKTKLKNLVALGIKEEWSRLIAYSRKRYWRLSNTPQINKALGIEYYRQQGLVTLMERYYKLRSV